MQRSIGTKLNIISKNINSSQIYCSYLSIYPFIYSFYLFFYLFLLVPFFLA